MAPTDQIETTTFQCRRQTDNRCIKSCHPNIPINCKSYQPKSISFWIVLFLTQKTAQLTVFCEDLCIFLSREVKITIRYDQKLLSC